MESSEHIAGASNGLGSGDAMRRYLSPEDERGVESEVAELRSSSAALTAAGQHQRSAELVQMAESVEEVLEGAVPGLGSVYSADDGQRQMKGSRRLAPG